MVHRGTPHGVLADTGGGLLRDVLRAGTREAHTALDRALTGGSRGVGSLDDYVRVLRTLHSLHRWSDDRLTSWAVGSELGRRLSGGTLPPGRSALYGLDLEALGAEPADLLRPPRPREAPVGDEEGVALLYLLGGSTAGARLLLRGLPAEVPAAARTGLTVASGPEAARWWRGVRGVLAQPVPGELARGAAREASALLDALCHTAGERAA